MPVCSIQNMRRCRVCNAGIIVAIVCTSAIAQESKPKDFVAELRKQADALMPLVRSPAVGEFLNATASLPKIETRVVFRNRKKNEAHTEAEYQALPESEKTACERSEYDEEAYYNTFYGSPLVYARLLDIAAQHGFDAYAGRRVMDFGYGTVGQLRLLASLGADAVGVEVQPVFRALYSQPGDQGRIAGRSGTDGKVILIHGRFPTDAEVKRKVGGGYDLFTSKNTLKRGYIHPEREADPRSLIDLGVDDETYVRALFDMLNPGGLVMIYNLCPAQNPPDKKYIPWADGRCPFDRELLEKTGFQILAYNEPDHETAYDYWFALGHNNGKTREELRAELFAHYTLFRRPTDVGP